MYATGPVDRPGVVLLHEVGGMSPQCVGLARELADPADGPAFRLYLPLLFGKPEQTTLLGVDLRGLFCIRREMHYLASSQTSPMTTRIRRLIVDIAETTTSTNELAVIGMCLTGNLIFGLMAECHVMAAVSSQPALPLQLFGKLTPRFMKNGLSVADRDLVEAVRSSTPLLALRFDNDWMCPRDRFDSLRDAFGYDGQLTIESVAGSGHSVLTAHRTTANDRVPLLRRFLVDHLG